MDFECGRGRQPAPQRDLPRQPGPRAPGPADDLWKWMADWEKKTGGRLLAIPHNGNLSNGRMFELRMFMGGAMTKDWAQQRQKYERLFEAIQMKGQSESHPSLSPTDEFAVGYEL